VGKKSSASFMTHNNDERYSQESSHKKNREGCGEAPSRKKDRKNVLGVTHYTQTPSKVKKRKILLYLYEGAWGKRELRGVSTFIYESKVRTNWKKNDGVTLSKLHEGSPMERKRAPGGRYSRTREEEVGEGQPR